MTRVSYEDMEEVFNGLASYSWQGLHDYLLSSPRRPEGISDDLAEAMARESMNLSRAGEPFPRNPQDLYDIVNGWPEAEAA